MRLLFHSLLGRARVRWVCLKLDVQGQGGGKCLDVDGQWGGGLDNLTNFMDVIYVSSYLVF